MASIEKQTFLREYTRALRDNTAALFIGAGVSRAAGYVDWKQFLREIAEELQLDVDRETDLVALAQYHVNHRQGRDRLNQLLIDEFLEDVELTQSHRLIASLPIHTVWSTNYDDLLEAAFQAAGKRVDVKRRAADFATTRRHCDVTIYKMHGDRTAPAEAIITKEDYETFNATREVFTIAFKGDLAQKTFLFIGFSFADPNVLYLLGRVKQLLDQNGRKHYCVLKPPRADDSPGGEYECRRFSHWLTDLSRYNIQPVLIDSYEEVPTLLAELNRRSHLRDVFISGSATDYQPLGEMKFRELCRLLGSQLIKKDFNIVSGFGLGVGDAVIVGAMQSLQRNDDERLQLWPFPQELPPDTDRATFWTQYRERMISHAGVCVVLAGNKLVSGQVESASGVREEVAIARSHGKIVIPIGATGHVARQVWTEIQANPSAYYGEVDVGRHLDTLGDEASSSEALVQATIDMLKLLER